MCSCNWLRSWKCLHNHYNYFVCVYVFGKRKWYHVIRDKNATRGGRSISHRIILLCMVGAISAESLVKQTTAKEEAVFAQAE